MKRISERDPLNLAMARGAIWGRAAEAEAEAAPEIEMGLGEREISKVRRDFRKTWTQLLRHTRSS